MKKITFSLIFSFALLFSANMAFALTPAIMDPVSSRICYAFARNLTTGARGEDVRQLQILLNQDASTQVSTSGAGSPGNETTYFGPATLRAIIKFQEKHSFEVLAPAGLVRGTGFVGRLTLQKLNRLCGPINNDGAPVISSISAPTTLAVNETGTWKITASDPFNKSLTYSVNWGDEYTYANTSATSVSPERSAIAQQNTEFTHSYPRAGSFTQTFTVTNASGKSVQTKTTVVVGGVVSTNKPVINSLIPASATVGSVVTIKGNNFVSGLQIKFRKDSIGTLEAGFIDAVYIDSSTLRFTVPNIVPRRYTCPAGYLCSPASIESVSPGQYMVTVVGTDGRESNVAAFTVISANSSAPSITSLSPSSGVVGSRVRIYGSNLSGGAVEFGSGFIPTGSVTTGSGYVEFTIPEYTGTCPSTSQVCNMMAVQITPGTYAVGVTTTNGTSNKLQLTVTSVSNPASITVVAPNGGEGLARGSQYTIKWQTPNVTYIQAPRFDIYLEQEGPACYYSNPQCLIAVQSYTIASNVIGSGGLSTYSWVVGNISSSNAYVSDGRYRIKVCTQGGGSCDTSDSAFTIASATTF